MATVQQPQSYSSCLTNLLGQAQTINDMFSGGFSISSFISTFAQAAVQNIIDGLENKVCKIIQSAAQGVFGSLKKNFATLSNGPVISLDAGSVGGSVTIPTSFSSLSFSMPTSTPSAPIVVPTAPTTPPTKPPSTIPTHSSSG